MTNISYSPNDKYVITGVSKLINSNDNDTNGKLIIFDRNDLSKPLNEILFNDSVIRTNWHPTSGCYALLRFSWQVRCNSAVRRNLLVAEMQHDHRFLGTFATHLTS